MDQIIKWAILFAVIAFGTHIVLDEFITPHVQDKQTVSENRPSKPISVAKKEPIRIVVQDTIEDPLPGRAQRIKAGRNGHFFLDAKVNGANIPFLVDTGASVVALSHEAAQRAGIRPKKSDYKHISNTANGQVRVAHVYLDQVRYRNIRVNDVSAVVLPKGALSGHSLLGNSFLSRLQEYKIKDGSLIMIP